MSTRSTLITSQVIDEGVGLSLRELCRLHGVQTRTVVALVHEGALEPVAGEDRRDWRFASSSVSRLGQALRLRRQLQLDLAGTALALDLLEEVERLRNRVAVLEGLLEPGAVRRR